MSVAVMNESRWFVGDDPVVDFSVTRDGAPFNLTGCEVQVAVTSNKASSFILSSAGVSPAVIITNPTGGAGTIDFNGKMEVVAGYAYRARIIESTGRQHTFDVGTYTVQ